MKIEGVADLDHQRASVVAAGQHAVVPRLGAVDIWVMQLVHTLPYIMNGIRPARCG